MAPSSFQQSSPVPLKEIDARESLVCCLDLLAAEKPQYVFATGDPFKVIIRNESGSDVYGGLSKRPVCALFGLLTLSLPGYLNTINYQIVTPRFIQGVTLYDHGDIFTHIARFPNGTWTGVGRRSQQDTPIEEVKLGFDVNKVNYALYPFGNQEDAALADRITTVFRKYGTFEMQQEKKSRNSKQFYDLYRSFKRAAGLQKPLEIKLLTAEKEEM